MPSFGSFTRERWRERWSEPWIEQSMAHRVSMNHGRSWARRWIPVIISLIVQVPAAFVTFRPGQGMHLLARSMPIPLLVLGIALALAGPLVLIAARKFPGPVVAIVAVLASADLLVFNTTDRPPYVALAFAIVAAIVRGARVWAWISVAAAWVATLLIAILTGVALQTGRITAITLGILIVMGVGEALRTRNENYREFSRRFAERKQSEVQAERVRIARELHDVLAHSLSQINVQAGVGLHLMDAQPDKARDALASIKETSKTALDEVRSVLGVLRAEGGADPSAPLMPEPDLSRLLGLAASIEAQGIVVHVENTISPPPPAPIQLALYRIAQESLTNVMRHARASAVTVIAGRDAENYVLSVTDNGTATPAPRQDSGGRGLLGMHERAELLGGSLEAGPRPGGGFRVTARLPARSIE
jgi:signal transduction histidine kinase